MSPVCWSGFGMKSFAYDPYIPADKIQADAFDFNKRPVFALLPGGWGNACHERG